MNKFLLIVELLSYFVNFLTRTSRQQELSSREQQNTEKPIDRFADKFGAPAPSALSNTTEFGKPSVPVNTGAAKDTTGLQQAEPSHDRPK